MNRQEVITEIESTFSSLKLALSGFSEDELNSVPFERSWTAGQVAEHIIKSIGGIPDKKTQSPERPYDEKIGPIREMFLDMETKFRTDPFLEPEKAHHQSDDLLNKLRQLKKQHIHSAREKDLQALCLDIELPSFGYLTRYEWIRFMMVHIQRHTRQIENIYNTIKSIQNYS